MSSVGVAVVVAVDDASIDVGVIVEGALIVGGCGGLTGVDSARVGGDNTGVLAICARVRGGVYLLIWRTVAGGGFGQGVPGVVTR